MIHRDTLSDTHLRDVARQLKIRDWQLLGRMVHALYLVEQLALHGLPFIFKGGTCLTLLVDRLDRLSIDVDIEVNDDVSDAQIEAILDRIVTSATVFADWELQVQRSARGTSKHYKLYYHRDAAQATDAMEHILLDVVRTSPEHPSVAERELLHRSLILDGASVRMITPTIEGLLGDKLTACAPLTVGISINAYTVPGSTQTFNKHLEMIKQLFDVNVLIPRAQDWTAVRATFERTLTVQRQVFGQDFTMDQVVTDLARRALAMFGQLDTAYHPDLMPAHEYGHRSTSNYLVERGGFSFEQVRMAALRAAYVAHCLRIGERPFTEFTSGSTFTLRSEQIKQIHKGLSKQLRPEAVTIIGILLEAGYAGS